MLLPRDGTLDQAVGVRLRCVNLSVFAGVFQSLVPA